MTGRYTSLRNAADNAAKIGNYAACRNFVAKMEACDWVEPHDWRPGVCFSRGIPLRGNDFSITKKFGTKKAVQAAARRIGWPVGAVTRVYRPIHGICWAIVDGRFGLMSESHYARLLSARNR